MTTMLASIERQDRSRLAIRTLRIRGERQPWTTQHSQMITKAINARNHGAKGMVVLNGKLGDGEEDLLTRFGSVRGRRMSDCYGAGEKCGG